MNTQHFFCCQNNHINCKSVLLTIQRSKTRYRAVGLNGYISHVKLTSQGRGVVYILKLDGREY